MIPIQCIKSSFSMWWTMTGSNCRHPACKAGALPAELIVHVVGDPWGNQTPDTAVKGRCLNRLTNGPEMVTHPRLERGTPWLKVRCSASWANESYKLAGVKGFEPLNDGVRVRCLTAWRYPYIYKGINLSKKNGSPSRTRTYDRSVNSRLLYRLSYRGMKVERKTRFELATPALARRCSTTELFPHFTTETILHR